MRLHGVVGTPENWKTKAKHKVRDQLQLQPVVRTAKDPVLISQKKTGSAVHVCTHTHVPVCMHKSLLLKGSVQVHS